MVKVNFTRRQWLILQHSLLHARNGVLETSRGVWFPWEETRDGPMPSVSEVDEVINTVDKMFWDKEVFVT